jgi:hypothetical protein
MAGPVSLVTDALWQVGIVAAVAQRRAPFLKEGLLSSHVQTLFREKSM